MRMARPLRIDVTGGWYHVTARGIERRAIFEDSRDHEHFIDLIKEMAERYGVQVHAYALMGNHYHLLIQTPGANASASIQWLNVSYSVWFNKRRDRVGHVFQGRFGSVLVDGDGAWALGASAYVHLNPVRTAELGLGKAANRAEAAGVVKPDGEALRQRLRTLRNYRWSSYPAYAGYAAIPGWLSTEELLRRAGGQKAYRRFVQQHVTRGAEPEGFEDIAGRVILGSRAFLERAKDWGGSVSREQPARRQLARCVPVEVIVKVVEKHVGEPWGAFADRHGDWGRDLALYLARMKSGLTLRCIGEIAGGMDYKSVSKAIGRFKASLDHVPARRRLVRQCLNDLSNVEM